MPEWALPVGVIFLVAIIVSVKHEIASAKSRARSRHIRRRLGL